MYKSYINLNNLSFSLNFIQVSFKLFQMNAYMNLKKKKIGARGERKEKEKKRTNK